MWLKKSLSYLSIAEVSLNFHDLGRVKCLKMHRGEWIIILKLSILPEIWYKVFSARKKVAKVSVQYIQYNLFHHMRSPNFETQPLVNAIYHIYIYIQRNWCNTFNTHSFCWKVWFHHHPHVLKPQQKGEFFRHISTSRFFHSWPFQGWKVCDLHLGGELGSRNGRSWQGKSCRPRIFSRFFSRDDSTKQIDWVSHKSPITWDFSKLLGEIFMYIIFPW